MDLPIYFISDNHFLLEKNALEQKLLQWQHKLQGAPNTGSMVHVFFIDFYIYLFSNYLFFRKNKYKNKDNLLLNNNDSNELIFFDFSTRRSYI